jgi:hypothetical protein
MKRTKSVIHRKDRQPRFARPLEVRVTLLPTKAWSGSASGLWRASSASTRSGDKSEPHSLGSGESENYLASFRGL